jgi:hypothetical protein
MSYSMIHKRPLIHNILATIVMISVLAGCKSHTENEVPTPTLVGAAPTIGVALTSTPVLAPTSLPFGPTATSVDGASTPTPIPIPPYDATISLPS